ncbi:MAG: creatininase family protein [Acidimicrobiia bacterium]|nr:creatininase family protein [Acidimicrobiia bacterium]MDH4309830.1 creatininase family protein [Acidimicrobiia bacterium]
MADEWLLENMSQPRAAALLAKGRAILVTGSVEQHGGHLPLGTDFHAASTIATRVAARIEAPVLRVSPVGVAPYHLPWQGSLTLRPRTLIDLMLDVSGGLAAAGVRTLLVVNWHEGNTPTIRLAADEIQRAHPVRVIVAETHIITNGMFPDEMEFTHAGAMETAAVLAHDESLVTMSEMLDGDPVELGTDGHALFRRRDVFPVMTDFREVAGSGWYGSPGSVSADRAREIIDAVADHVTAAFEEVASALAERVAVIGGPA